MRLPFRNELSPQELAVAKLICRGLTNKQISRELGIALGTVQRRVRIIVSKVGAKNRTTAAVMLFKAIAAAADGSLKTLLRAWRGRRRRLRLTIVGARRDRLEQHHGGGRPVFRSDFGQDDAHAALYRAESYA
jgi:DNA-binding CsgD family transcriptional regulator